MIDGTYDVELINSAIRKKGTMEIRSEGDRFSAEIKVPLIGTQQVEGSLDGNNFSAEGTFKLMFVGKIAYTMRGEAIDDGLHMFLETSKGDFEATGTRI